MQSGKTNLLALLALSLGYFSVGTISLAVVGLNVPIGADLDVPPAQVGFQVTIFALTFAIAAPFAPEVLRRLDRKHALMIGLGLLTVGGALGALAPSYGLLSVTRVIAALGAAIFAPGASALGATIVPPERRQRALVIVFAGMTAAAVLGVPLASFLGSTLGWRPALLGVAVLSAIGLAMVTVLVPRVPMGEPPTLRSFLGVLRTHGAMPTVATTLLFMAAQFTIYGIAGAYLAARFDANAALISITLLGFGVVGVLGTILSAPIAERLGGARTVTIALVGLGVAFVVLTVLRATVPGLILFVLWAFFSQLYQAPQQNRLVGLVPSQPALILAMNASALYLGMSLGSTVGSALLPAVGAGLIPAFGLVFVLAAAAAHYVSVRRFATVATPAVPGLEPADAPARA